MRLFITIRHIFSRYSSGEAFRLVLEYLRIITKNRFASREEGVEKVLGYSISYPYRPHFFGTIAEIFFQRIYKFPDKDLRIIVDAGANIGIASIYFKWRYPDAQIVSFEPNKEAVEYLRRNIRENKLRDVEIYDCALGRENTSTNFYVSKSVKGSTSATLSPADKSNGKETSITVKVRKLSDFIKEPIDLLKLDVEGAEGEVLEELERESKLGMISRMIIEFHIRDGRNEYPLSTFLSILERNNHRYRVEPQFRNVPIKGSKNLRTYLIFTSLE